MLGRGCKEGTRGDISRALSDSEIKWPPLCIPATLPGGPAGRAVGQQALLLLAGGSTAWSSLRSLGETSETLGIINPILSAGEVSVPPTPEGAGGGGETSTAPRVLDLPAGKVLRVAVSKCPASGQHALPQLHHREPGPGVRREGAPTVPPQGMCHLSLSAASGQRPSWKERLSYLPALCCATGSRPETFLPPCPTTERPKLPCLSPSGASPSGLTGRAAHWVGCHL